MGSRLKRPNRVAVALSALAALALAGYPAKAEPCTCGRFPPGEILVEGATRVPTNAHIPIVLGLAAGKEEGRFRLRPSDGAEVALSVERYSGGEDGHVVLRPAVPLEADTSYRLEARWGERVVEAAFRTAPGSDAEAPTAPKLVSARHVPRPQARRVLRDGKSVLLLPDPCASDEAAVVLEIVPAEDGRTPPSAMRYAVWLFPPERAPAEGTRPDAYLLAEAVAGPGAKRPERAVLTVGRESICQRQFVKVPARWPRLTVRVAAEDLAGNRSASRDVVVDLDR